MAERDQGSGHAGNPGENVLAVRVVECGKGPAVQASRLGEFSEKKICHDCKSIVLIFGFG